MPVEFAFYDVSCKRSPENHENKNNQGLGGIRIVIEEPSENHKSFSDELIAAEGYYRQRPSSGIRSDGIEDKKYTIQEEENLEAEETQRRGMRI